MLIVEITLAVIGILLIIGGFFVRQKYYRRAWLTVLGGLPFLLPMPLAYGYGYLFGLQIADPGSEYYVKSLPTNPPAGNKTGKPKSALELLPKKHQEHLIAIELGIVGSCAALGLVFLILAAVIKERPAYGPGSQTSVELAASSRRKRKKDRLAETDPDSDDDAAPKAIPNSLTDADAPPSTAKHPKKKPFVRSWDELRDDADPK